MLQSQQSSLGTVKKPASKGEFRSRTDPLAQTMPNPLKRSSHLPLTSKAHTRKTSTESESNHQRYGEENSSDLMLEIKYSEMLQWTLAGCRSEESMESQRNSAKESFSLAARAITKKKEELLKLKLVAIQTEMCWLISEFSRNNVPKICPSYVPCIELTGFFFRFRLIFSLLRWCR